MYYLITALVQIITESLPISSSGHIQLMHACMHIKLYQTNMQELITFAMHLPTAIIVALFFRHDYWPTIVGIRKTWPYVLQIVLYGFAVELITVLWYGLIAWLDLRIPLWIGFACTSISLLSLRWCTPAVYGTMTLRKALLLGCVQGIALCGGISRLALTFTVCCWMGLRPMRALQWSLMVQWPLIFVAALYGSYALFDAQMVQLLHVADWLSMLGATIIAYMLLAGISYMVRSNLMWIWGIYMLVPTSIAWCKKL
jgi:undecaprenyl-diphosphatase